MAPVVAVAREDAEGKEFGVTTAAAEKHSSDAEWAAALDAVL